MEFKRGTFGAFVSELPVGTEIISVSGRVTVWLGLFGNGGFPGSPLSAYLYPVDQEAKLRNLGTCKIHMQAPNMWTVTGKHYGEGFVSAATGFVVEDIKLQKLICDWQRFLEDAAHETASRIVTLERENSNLEEALAELVAALEPF